MVRRIKFRFIAAIIVVALFAVPGMLVAQNPDLSQNPTPDQATAPPSQDDQYQGQDQAQGSDQDQDMLSPDASGQAAPEDQNQRPPMTELPPPPNKPSPNIQGPGPYGPGGPTSAGPNNANENPDRYGVARLSLIHGNVSTRRGDSGEWSAAQLNAPLMAGDSVSTGDKSRVELQLDYANILRLSEQTQANITALSKTQIQIQLGHGMANYTVMGNSETTGEIDTPNVSIRTERRDASFRILVTADDHTEVLVRRGEVEVTTPQGGTRVGENQFIVIRGTGDQTQYRIGEAPARDDWDQWNTDRDRLIRDSLSRKNTDQYYVGSQDLDANGQWQNVPDYGQAWFPNQGPEWAPYSDGSWVWEPYWGWTWVSYEPWGWAPYHYGRWFFYGGRWGWWPGPVYGYPYYQPIWAPAYVSFFGFGGGFGFGFGWGWGGGWGSIGWFPIGPCDRFHPWWGGYGRGFGHVGVGLANRGGWGPLHGGTRFSNYRLATQDPRFRGATSVAANEFGRGHTNYVRATHAMMRNAHFATGNLPVVPNRQSLSASGRPAAPGSVVNRGGNQHFFSPHGTATPSTGRTFAQEQAGLSNAMRQNRVTPITGNERGAGGQSNARLAQPGFHAQAPRSENSPGGNRETPREGSSGANGGYRGFSPSGGGAAGTHSAPEPRGGSNWGSVPRPGNSAPTHEPGGTNNGGWQKFTPMPPRSSSPGPSEGSGGRPPERAGHPRFSAGERR
jgi:hypothetical protein